MISGHGLTVNVSWFSFLWCFIYQKFHHHNCLCLFYPYTQSTNKMSIVFQAIQYERSLLGIHNTDYSQYDLYAHIQDEVF